MSAIDEDDDPEAAALANPGFSRKQKWLLSAVVVGLIAIVVVPMIIAEMREDEVLATGTPAPAVVLELSETGNAYNEVPELRIVLEVRPAQGQPFRAEVREVVAAHDTPKIQPGTEISVKYDPEHPTRVAIVEPKL